MSYPQKPWSHSRKKLWVWRGGGLQAAVGRANGSKGEDFGLEAKATRTSGGDGSMNRRTMPLYLFVTLMILALLPSPAAGSVTTKEAVSPEALEFFEKQIRPLLADKCYSCHGPEGTALFTAPRLQSGNARRGYEGPLSNSRESHKRVCCFARFFIRNSRCRLGPSCPNHKWRTWSGGS